MGKEVVGLVNGKKRGQEAIRASEGVSVQRNLDIVLVVWDSWKGQWLSLSTARCSELMQENEGE